MSFTSHWSRCSKHLPTLVFGLCQFSTLSTYAMESFYVVNQKADKNSFEFRYTFSDGGYNTDVFRQGSKATTTSHAATIEFRRNFENNQSAWVGGRLIGRKINLDNQQNFSAVGIGDLELGFKKGEVYDLLTTIYGLSATVSPGLAQDPRLANINRVNNFSGTQSFAPFYGVEAYSGNMAIGGLVEVRLFSDIRYEDAGHAKTFTNPNRFIPKVRGFVEVPITKSWDWGMEMSVARYNFALDQLLFGGTGNEYEAMMYGQWKMDSQTTLLAMVLTKDQKYPLPETKVDVSLGIRKEL